MIRRAAIGLVLLVAGAVFLWRAFVPDVPSVSSGKCQPSSLYMTRIAPVLATSGLYRPPCAVFRFQSASEFDREVRLNSLGLHAPELSILPTGETIRLLIVGDSFPQALQVAPEQAFSQITAVLLEQQSGKKVEMLNLSMDAFGTDRELLLYALVGAAFQPDVVLLSFYMGNDVQDNQRDLETRRYGYALDRPFFTLDGAGSLRLHGLPLLDPALDSSAAYQWLAAQPVLPSPDVVPPDHPAVLTQDPYQLEYPVELGLYLPPDAQWDTAWAITEALLSQFQDLVTAEGLRFGVLLIPDRRAVHEEDWGGTLNQYGADLPALRTADPAAPGQRLSEFLQSAGIPVLNLTGTLRSRAQSRPSERLYFPDDGHFTPAGHRATAERLVSWLLGAGLLP